MNWKGLAEIVGVSAIVASLIFIGFQMRQDRAIATAQIFSEYGETHAQWVALLADNMDIWIRGLNGSELDETGYAQFDALALGYVVLQRTKYYRSTAFTGPTETLVRDVAYFIYQYPGLKDWHTLRMRYHAERGVFGPFRQALARDLEALENGSIKPITIESYIPNN